MATFGFLRVDSVASTLGEGVCLSLSGSPMGDSIFFFFLGQEVTPSPATAPAVAKTALTNI